MYENGIFLLHVLTIGLCRDTLFWQGSDHVDGCQVFNVMWRTQKMVRNLMLIAALVGSMVFAHEAQAFGKKSCSSCGQGQAVSGCSAGSTCGQATAFGSSYVISAAPVSVAPASPAPTTVYTTPYIAPATYSTPYTAPAASTVTSSPSIVSQTATINGRAYTLTQTGTLANGQPVYTITPAVTSFESSPKSIK